MKAALQGSRMDSHGCHTFTTGFDRPFNSDGSGLSDDADLLAYAITINNRLFTPASIDFVLGFYLSSKSFD